MQLALSIEGADRPADMAADLANWLRNSRLKDVDEVRQEQSPPAPGEQGPELQALLSVVLAGPAVVAFVHCLFRYLEARRPKMKIKLKRGTETLEIDCTNPPSLEELTDAAEALFKDHT